MKIIAKDTYGKDTHASKIDGGYWCYPKNTNTEERALSFDRIEDAGQLLIMKPD
ncbi:MAG: hypothetical protein ACR2PF_16170 [Rhizobiaceae bacterium]